MMFLSVLKRMTRMLSTDICRRCIDASDYPWDANDDMMLLEMRVLCPDSGTSDELFFDNNRSTAVHDAPPEWCICKMEQGVWKVMHKVK